MLVSALKLQSNLFVIKLSLRFVPPLILFQFKSQIQTAKPLSGILNSMS